MRKNRSPLYTYVLAVVGLLALGAVACDTPDNRGASSFRTHLERMTKAAAIASSTLSVTTVNVYGESRGRHRFLGDGDADNPTDIDNDADVLKPGEYNDNDTDHDIKTRESHRYRDKDDNEILRYGHAADMADAQAIAMIVKRYFAAAAVGDGTAACSLVAPSIATGLSQAALIASQTKTKACPAVLSTLFKDRHRQMSTALTITGVRVDESQAYVLLSSPSAPAQEILVEQVGGAWKVGSLLGNPLP